jgi:hypothetical protein
MPTNTPNCRNCRTAMDEGWVADRHHNNSVSESKWVEGEPQHQRWLGIDFGITMKGKVTHEVTVWRCAKCGLLESYAL